MNWGPLFIILLTISAVSTAGDKCLTMSSSSQDFLKQHYAVDSNTRWIVPRVRGGSVENECSIRNMKPQHGAQCLTQKKILYFGDSMSRDFGVSLVHFLNDEDNPSSMSGKHEKSAIFEFKKTKQNQYLCVCGKKHNRQEDTHVFGKEAFGMHKKNKNNCVLALSYSANSRANWRVDIAYEGSYSSPQSWQKLEAMHSIFSYDLIILGNHGFHGINKNVPNYPAIYMNPLLQYDNTLLIDDDKWKEIRKEKSTRMSMPYLYLFANTNHDDLKGPISKSYRQSYLVEYINAVSRDFLDKHALPYFDNLLVSANKEASADGVHLHKWGNLILVKLLLHFICSEQLQFKGNAIFSSGNTTITST